MPGKAKGEKDKKWKLARNAVWGCVPARLGSEVPATWVPATELVPGGERAPWSSSSWGKTVWGAGQETWTPVGATGVSGRRFGPVHVFRYRPNRVGVATRAWYILAQAASLGGTPSAAYAAAGAEPLTRRQQLGVGRTREAIGNLPAVKELALHLGAEVARSPAAAPATNASRGIPRALLLSAAAVAQQPAASGARRSNRGVETTVGDVEGILDGGGDLGGLNQASQPRRDAALRTLIELANTGMSAAAELERIKDAPTALDLITLFTPEAMQHKIFGSKGAPATMRSASFAPASASFQDVQHATQSRVTTAMTAIATKVAETLFTQDAPALLRAMSEQRHFRDFVLPQSAADDESGYAEFARNKAVLAIGNQLNGLYGLSRYSDTRTQLLGLLASYPRPWINRMCEELKEASKSQPSACLICSGGADTCECPAPAQQATPPPACAHSIRPAVSKEGIAKARVLAMQHGAGTRAPATEIRRPGRRHGAQEEFLVAWFADEQNIERVDQGDGGVRGTRVLSRNRGFDAYERAAKADGKPYVVLSLSISPN